MNWITYKEVFPLIKDNKLWLGYSKVKEFKQPDGTYKKFGNKLWYTNVDTEKRHHKLETVYRWYKCKEKNSDLYPKYDNYAAIEVGKVSQIPLDYNGIMGVPITFLDKFNPDQFEILGMSKYRGKYGADWLGIKPIGRRWLESYRAYGGRGHYSANMIVPVYFDKNGVPKPSYARVIIKNKHPENYQNDSLILCEKSQNKFRGKLTKTANYM